MTESTHARDKSFPRFCPECGQLQVRPATIRYDADVKHDGRLYSFRIPSLQVNKCGACGEILFSNVTDDQISQGLREHLSLLSPTQIRDALRLFSLKQKDLGDRIGVAPETISRWISGTHLQSRAMDNLMRLFFAFDNVRSALGTSAPNRNLGTVPVAKVKRNRASKREPRKPAKRRAGRPPATGNANRKK